LPSGPLDVYSSAQHNRVELLIGCNSDEGVTIAGFIAKMFGVDIDKLDVATAGTIMAGFLSMNFTFPNMEQVAGAVAAQYLSDVESTASSEDIHKILVEFFTDALFLAPTIKTADHHSRMYTLSRSQHRSSYIVHACMVLKQAMRQR
jgi:carboxylesterase type B